VSIDSHDDLLGRDIIMNVIVRRILMVFLLALVPGMANLAPDAALAAEKKVAVLSPKEPGKPIVYNNMRYPKPAFYHTNPSVYAYKGLILVSERHVSSRVPGKKVFLSKIRQAIDLIEKKSPKIFKMMLSVNPGGKRLIYYTGKVGPASFAAYNRDFIVNISASSIDDDPVFENTAYSLAATLVHELIGHGKQEADGRIWPMYDWCGRKNAKVKGVRHQTNHMGVSSGFIEYEPNLYAKWFLETVRGTYPNLNEPAVRRYVKTVRNIKKRFPGWYNERKTARQLLIDFESHFKEVCPGLRFTPHS